MGNYSILVIDDEEIIRTAIGYDLERKEFNVELAESGETGIKLFTERLKEDSGFDLVITDILMEGIDGIAVLKKIKDMSPATMVIIITGHANLESAMSAVKLHADDYLLKPCKQYEIEFAINQCLKRLELQRKVKLYENLLPVCCVCNNIRDDSGTEIGKGKWTDMAVYLQNKAKIDVSHTYCTTCFNKKQKEINGY